MRVFYKRIRNNFIRMRIRIRGIFYVYAYRLKHIAYMLIYVLRIRPPYLNYFENNFILVI